MQTAPFLRGKTAIITGAGRGIGRAVARRLSAAGASVVIAARSVEQLDETQRLIENAGGRVLAVRADVSQESDVDRLIAETGAAFGGVDILVNNAGAAPAATIEEMELRTFDQLVAANIRSVFLCSRAVWPTMAEKGEGVIVNIASIAAYDPLPGLTAYGASKAFVVAFTKFLAPEGAPKGIRIYGIAPGAVETEMLRSVAPDFPVAEALSPDDIAAMLETLLTPACRYSSGQTIVVRKGFE